MIVNLQIGLKPRYSRYECRASEKRHKQKDLLENLTIKQDCTANIMFYECEMLTGGLGLAGVTGFEEKFCIIINDVHTSHQPT